MKYIKTYEKLDNKPKVGDYVVCEEDIMLHDEEIDKFYYFLYNSVGVCVFIKLGKSDTFYDDTYYIQYSNIPKSLAKLGYFSFKPDNYDNDIANCRYMSFDEIVFYSKDSEECISYISAKKYNL